MALHASRGGGPGAGVFTPSLQVTVDPDFLGFAMAGLLAFVPRPLEDFGATVSMIRAMGVRVHAGRPACDGIETVCT
jgi:hypothetical protein